MFWGLTLRQFVMLADRHRERVKREDRRAGEVVAILYNINRDPKKDPDGWTWLEVFPEHREPKREQTEEELLEVMKLWAAVTREKPQRALNP